MLRFIGTIVVVVSILVGALYIGGYWEDASVSVTDKGRRALNNGVSVVQDGVNSGLNNLKVKEKTTK